MNNNRAFFRGSNFKAAFWLALFSSYLFVNTLNNGFTYDDSKLVLDNPFLTGESGLRDLLSESRVVRTISLMLDHKLFGYSSWGFHLQNVFWHVLSTVLLYFFLLRLSKDQTVAILSAFLFACHPVHVEAVANVSNRKDLLCLSFSLITFLLYLKTYDCRGRNKHITIALIFPSFALAIFSKQAAAILPVMIFAYERYFINRGEKRLLHDNLASLLPVVVLSVLYGIYLIKNFIDNFFVDVGAGRFTFLEYHITKITTILFYNSMLLWPVNMSADHVYRISGSFLEQRVLFAVFAWLLLVFATIKSRKSAPLLSFGILWYIVNLLPVLIVPGATYFAAERYLYIPSVGFVLVLSIAIVKLFHFRNKTILMLLMSIVLLYTANTFNRNTIWKNGFTLWSDTVKKYPNSAIAHNNLGNAYRSQGSIDKAMDHYKRALALKPDNPVFYYNVGGIHADGGRLDEALSNYQAALRLNPNFVEAHYKLGDLYLERGRPERARAEYDAILKFNPKHLQARQALESLEKR